MFSASKCTSCGLCLGYCDARTIDPATHKLIYDRAKCTVCGKCEPVCPHHVNKICGRTSTTDEILGIVLQDRHFYETSGGGMTVSGGEPSAQKDAVLELIAIANGAGITSAVETSGVGSRDFYKQAADLGALFLYDIKGVDQEKHLANTGTGTQLIHDNLDYLIGRGANIIIRIPLIPGYNDSENDIFLLCDFLKARKDGIMYAEIMPYHNLGVGKRHHLGIDAKDDIPDGKQFRHEWRRMLLDSGVEIRISGS